MGLSQRRNTLLQKFVEVRGNSELAPSIGHFVEGVKDRSIIPRIETLGHTEIARSTIGRHNNWVVINSKIAGSQDIGKQFFLLLSCYKNFVATQDLDGEPMRPPEVNPERNLAVVEVRFARWLTKELNPVDAEVACQP